MSTIRTTYRGPADMNSGRTRGARICAMANSGERLTVPRHYQLDPIDDHRNAAIQLAERIGADTTDYRYGSFGHSLYWIFA